VAHFDQQPIGEPAKIIKGLRNEQAKEGDTIVLKALITGNPLPTVMQFLKQFYSIFLIKLIK
jgi:hypothetical protein